MKKLDNVILLSGRMGSGKTQMLIAFANMYPKTTLFVSQESSKSSLMQNGLNREIAFSDELKDADLSRYETVCIDYLELFDREKIKSFILKAMEQNLRVIVATQMKQNGETTNIFKELFDAQNI